MKAFLKVKKPKGKQRGLNHPLEKPVRGYSENILTPVKLVGVVLPWHMEVGVAGNSDYKLVSASGLEYYILANKKWRSILALHSGEEVKVIGLLNAANLTLIPQKVFPKGPQGERDNVIDLAVWKTRKAVTNMAKNVNDLVLIPAAVLAVVGFEVIG